MRRSLLLVSLLAFAPRAHAQTAPEPTCETITTVHCSGSAAPLAVGQPAAPVVAPTPVPAPLPPLGDDCGTCAEAPRALVAPRIVPTDIGAGWHLELDPLAGASYVRAKRSPRPGVWVPGMVVWIASWIGATADGVIHDGNPWAAIPVFGAMGSGIAYGLFDGGTGRAAGYMLSSIGQAAGMVTFIVGLSGNKALERMPVQLAPTASRDGGGMGLTYKF